MLCIAILAGDARKSFSTAEKQLGFDRHVVEVGLFAEANDTDSMIREKIRSEFILGVKPHPQRGNFLRMNRRSQ